MKQRVPCPVCRSGQVPGVPTPPKSGLERHRRACFVTRPPPLGVAPVSHGPVDSKRHNELTEWFAGARPGLVYVTSSPNRAVMGKYLVEISWETEMWCADTPSHLIHFD